MGIQNFQILQPLGKGAFASVFKVTRLADGKTYALKRVNIENMSQKELDDTLNEIRFLASFKHPRLVRWYETFLEKDDTELCIVMEFCGCGDLAQKIERYKKRRQYIDERVIWVYLIQMLEGLKALHEKNIMHRDLKAANCFLAEDGSIKIGDMNVSKVMREGLLKTQIGTPYYMSPEIWSNRPYNASSDIWSLGCLMYELCSLRPPFLGDSLPSLKTAVLSGTYPPIPSVYSHELSATIARLLQLNPRDRPQAREALLLPEVVARKCLVKNAMTEADEQASPELMPTIRVSKMSALASKLPKPAYPDEMPPMEAPDVPMLALQVSTVPSEGSGGVDDPFNRKSSVAPIAGGEQPNYQRRASAYNPEEDGRIKMVAEQAQERLRGLLVGQADQSKRGATGANVMGDDGDAPRLVSGQNNPPTPMSPQPRRGSVLVGGLALNINAGDRTPGRGVGGGAPLPSPMGLGKSRSQQVLGGGLERQGSIKRTITGASDEASTHVAQLSGLASPGRRQSALPRPL